jgi:hypothetical protein
MLVVGSFASAKDAPKQKAKRFKVERNLFASSVHVDQDGLCQTASGVKLKAWYVAGFPAEIPAFESCTTISSASARGGVDIELAIVDRKKRTLLKVDGILDLGSDGRASQAIDWDHLEIPSAGTYYLVVRVEGKVSGRFPMRFRLRGSKRSQ